MEGYFWGKWEEVSHDIFTVKRPSRSFCRLHGDTEGSWEEWLVCVPAGSFTLLRGDVTL